MFGRRRLTTILCELACSKAVAEWQRGRVLVFLSRCSWRFVPVPLTHPPAGFGAGGGLVARRRALGLGQSSSRRRVCAAVAGDALARLLRRESREGELTLSGRVPAASSAAVNSTRKYYGSLASRKLFGFFVHRLLR